MIHPPSFTSLLLIFMVLVLIFGRRLPAIGQSLGEALKNFKKGLQDEDEVFFTPSSEENLSKEQLMEEIKRLKLDLKEEKEKTSLYGKSSSSQKPLVESSSYENGDVIDV